MTAPFSFEDKSPRFALPLLYSGQAQKEFFVNEALSKIDALLHLSVESEVAVPPTAPEDGKAWIVAAQPSGDWADREGALACRQSGNWIFVDPQDGMQVFNLAANQWQVYKGTWKKAAAVQEPIGGSTVDVEVRAALSELTAALKSLGILPEV